MTPLRVIDGTPTAISKFIREEEERKRKCPKCGSEARKRWHTRCVVQRVEYVCDVCGLVTQPSKKKGQWYRGHSEKVNQ